MREEPSLRINVPLELCLNQKDLARPHDGACLSRTNRSYARVDEQNVDLCCFIGMRRIAAFVLQVHSDALPITQARRRYLFFSPRENASMQDVFRRTTRLGSTYGVCDKPFRGTLLCLLPTAVGLNQKMNDSPESYFRQTRAKLGVC